jgi:hypothetical protein
MATNFAGTISRTRPRPTKCCSRSAADGLYEKVLHEEAAKAGVPLQNFQDVGWAGFKNGKDKENAGGEPMIHTVNEAIERTHRLPGMPKDGDRSPRRRPRPDPSFGAAMSGRRDRRDE